MKHHKTLPQNLPLTQEHLVEGMRTRIAMHETWADKMADFLTNLFGSTWFFLFNFALFAFWFLSNAGILGIPSFDPYPYEFLTMVVSLEAIFLAIIVLMSQNRAGKIAELRQKMDFEVNVRAEEEITKIILLIDKLHGHLGIKHMNDPELREMEHKLNLEEIRKLAEE